MSVASLTSPGHTAILTQPSTPIKEQPEMSEQPTPDDETPMEFTPTKRAVQHARDEETWEKYLHLGSWVQVAKAMNYANGSCARRAGLRHANRNNLLVNSDNPQVA